MSIRDEILKDQEKQPKKKAYTPDHKSLEVLQMESTLNKMFYNRANLAEERVGLHASSIIKSDADFCYRQQVLSLIFKQSQNEQHPERLMRIFAAGNSIHEKWQTMVMKTKMGIAEEDRSFSEEWELYFTPDLQMYKSLNSHKKYVVEIKSMNTFSFQKAKSHPSGSKQIQMYMHFKGIGNGVVLAEDKNTQDFKLFEVKYDPEVVIPFLNRLYEIKLYREAYDEEGTVPPRKCRDCNQKRAKDCNMRDACWNLGEGRQKLY